VDGNRFDELTRGIASSGSRRKLLGGLAGVVLGALGVGTAAARTCSETGRVCREHADCCSKLCGPKNATGRRTCSCQVAGDCPAPPRCRQAVCNAGICGTTVTVNASCNDNNPCTSNDVCNASGQCVGTPVGNGTACTVGGQAGTCSGGDCVPCAGPGGACPNGTGDCCGAIGELVCPEGTCCIPSGSARSCTDDDECCDGLFCDEATGDCVADGSFALGAACEENTDCATGACDTGTCDTGVTATVCCIADGQSCATNPTACCSGLCSDNLKICVGCGSLPNGDACRFGGTDRDDACASGRCDTVRDINSFCCSVDTVPVGGECLTAEDCCDDNTSAVDCCDGFCVASGCDPNDPQQVCGCL
jgi:hypothetical protein